MNDMFEYIFFNGQLLPYSKMPFHPGDRGLLFGDGVFETIRIRGGMPLFLERHWNRFSQGSCLLDIPIPLTLPELNTAILGLLAKNNLAHSDAIIRVTMTRGQGPREIWPTKELKATVVLSAWPFHTPLKKEITAIISSVCRNEHSLLSNIKSLNYLDNILARREAMQKNADEAILLNTQGKVAEAATANIFIAKNHVLFTPCLTDGALCGVMRLWVLETAGACAIAIKEKTITVTDLLNADEVFLTNVVYGIMPVIKLGEKKIISSSSQRIAAQLQHCLAEFLETKSAISLSQT